MTTVNAIGRIRSRYLELIPSEKRIADVVLADPAKTAHMSIDDLSAASNVSKTTVTRFCKHLGYTGYKDFIYAMILSTTSERPTDLFGSLNSDDSAATIVSKVSAANCKAIENTAKLIDPENIEKVAEKIAQARRIVLLANGGSSVIALDFYHKFLRLGVECIFNFDSRMQQMMASMSSPEDVVIGFTFSGGNKEVVNCMELAKEKGAATVGFTNVANSPLARTCDLILNASNSVESRITSSIEPRIAMLNVVDSLFLLYVARHTDQVSESLAETLEILNKTRIGD